MHSYMGVLLTLVLLLIMAIFIETKIEAWRDKKDVNIMGVLIENHFDFDYKFDADQGFFLAAAITAYDGDTEIVERPEYGELIIEQYGWGDDDTLASSSKPLNYHTCTDEELGFVKGPNTIIYPVFKSS